MAPYGQDLKLELAWPAGLNVYRVSIGFRLQGFGFRACKWCRPAHRESGGMMNAFSAEVSLTPNAVHLKALRATCFCALVHRMEL